MKIIQNHEKLMKIIRKPRENQKDRRKTTRKLRKSYENHEKIKKIVPKPREKLRKTIRK